MENFCKAGCAGRFELRFVVVLEDLGGWSVYSLGGILK